jgi:hypothetical protein
MRQLAEALGYVWREGMGVDFSMPISFGVVADRTEKLITKTGALPGKTIWDLPPAYVVRQLPK